MARAVAGEWKLPLVKFDTSAVYDKYIGETEKRIRKVFQVAEGLAPCVLWIDELEKVFAGSGPDSASADAGVSSRLLASFLSWMQDRKAPVFVAATCNNVTVLPPELIRKGRFDELFFVDLPRIGAETDLYHTTRQAEKESRGLRSGQVRHAAKGYSGAEIDAAVQGALYAAYSERRSSHAGIDRRLARPSLFDHPRRGDCGARAMGKDGRFRRPSDGVRRWPRGCSSIDSPSDFRGRLYFNGSDLPCGHAQFDRPVSKQNPALSSRYWCVPLSRTPSSARISRTSLRRRAT